MSNLSDLLRALRHHWARQELDTGKPASEAELLAWEQRYGVRLPSDLRAYFRELNGTARHQQFDREWDEDMIRFYPLEDFRPLGEETPDTAVPNATDFFVFADYSIWAWGYAIRLMPAEAAGEVHVVYDSETVRVASSFSEFVRGYLARDYSVTSPR